MHTLDITLLNLANPWPTPLPYLGTPIDSLLNKLKSPITYKTQMTNTKIHAIEQLTNHTNTQILE